MIPQQATRRLLDLLEEKASLYADSSRAVSVAAGWERDYLSQVLRGNVAVKASHVYAVLEELDVPAGDFFTELHPPGRRDERLALLLREAVLREEGAEAGRQRRASNPSTTRHPALPPDLEARVDRLVRLVRRAVRARGFTLAGTSRRMGRPDRYLSRLLADEPDLPLIKVYTILQAIGVRPATFFGALHPPGRGRNGGRNGGRKSGDPAGDGGGRLTREDLREEVQRAVREALEELVGLVGAAPKGQ